MHLRSGSALNPADGAYSAPPDSVACCPFTKNLFPLSALVPSASIFTIPPRQIYG